MSFWWGLGVKIDPNSALGNNLLKYLWSPFITLHIAASSPLQMVWYKFDAIYLKRWKLLLYNWRLDAFTIISMALVLSFNTTLGTKNDVKFSAQLQEMFCSILLCKACISICFSLLDGRHASQCAQYCHVTQQWLGNIFILSHHCQLCSDYTTHNMFQHTPTMI